MSDKNWIQKATKNMRKDKPCTGEKFGSETCPPGSKRYNLAKTFRKMAKEGHKLASLEKASVLSASDDPSDQDKAREIRVRHDYESLKKQIGSKKKPTKPAVNETKMPNVSSNDKKAIKSRAKNLFKRDLKGEHDGVNESVGGGVPMTPQELEIQKKMSRLNVRLAKKRNAQMMKAKVKDTESSPEQVKEAKLDKGRSDYGKATIRNWRHSGPSTVEPAMFDPENKRGKTIEKRREEHKARRGVKGAKVTTYKKEEVELDERLGGKGYSRKAAASSVYPGKKGTGDWEDSDRGAGNKAARRAGKKVEKKSPTYRAYVLNKEEVSIMEEDKAFNTVVAALRKKHGKDAILTKDSPKPKPPSEAQKKKTAAERKKRQDADNKAYASRAKKAGFKSTQDYTDVVARYGSEDNYRKGKGLGT
tara:strand:+ start:162 stop:1415 length:1254 start_codon:yes stop_codon:yes gene_type:complete